MIEKIKKYLKIILWGMYLPSAFIAVIYLLNNKIIIVDWLCTPQYICSSIIGIFLAFIFYDTIDHEI